MYRKLSSFSGVLLLAGALVFATASPSEAAGHGGGGHGGGGRGGGFHGGGFHGSGFHGSGFHGGFGHRGFGFDHRGFGHRGWGFPYWGGYGYYPYGSTSVYPYADTSGYPYGSTYVAPDASLYDGYEEAEPYAEAPPAAAADRTVQVTVTVPPDAQVWFEGTKTNASGSIREYQSPPLTPGQRYTYTIRATWNQDGQPVTQEQKVTVTAGEHVNVTFPKPGTNPTGS